MSRTRLKQIRLLGGYSQAEISKQTRIHYSTLSRLENGIITPNENHRLLLAKFFNIEEELLFPDPKSHK